jgi:hypothetical protein
VTGAPPVCVHCTLCTAEPSKASTVALAVTIALGAGVPENAALTTTGATGSSDASTVVTMASERVATPVPVWKLVAENESV